MGRSGGGRRIDRPVWSGKQAGRRRRKATGVTGPPRRDQCIHPRIALPPDPTDYFGCPPRRVVAWGRVAAEAAVLGGRAWVGLGGRGMGGGGDSRARVPGLEGVLVLRGREAPGSLVRPESAFMCMYTQYIFILFSILFIIFYFPCWLHHRLVPGTHNTICTQQLQ